MGRLLAIGDIHGCSGRAARRCWRPSVRSPTTRWSRWATTWTAARTPAACSNGCCELARQCRLVPLLGNHDEMMLKVYDGRTHLLRRLAAVRRQRHAGLVRHACGPTTSGRTRRVSREAAACIYETERHFFVHGNYQRRVAAGEAARARRSSGNRSKTPARPALLRQDGHRGPHLPEERRDPRPGLPEVHRHMVLRRGLADGAGGEERPSMAGHQEWPAAVSVAARTFAERKATQDDWHNCPRPDRRAISHRLPALPRLYHGHSPPGILGIVARSWLRVIFRPNAYRSIRGYRRAVAMP